MESTSLTHYGVKGMRWGVRKTRKWATSRHQPSSARSSYLAGLYAATGNERVGKALDKNNARDAANWQRAKKEYKEYSKRKTEKKQFKADVKDFKKNGFEIDYEINTKTGEFTVTQYYNSQKRKLGKEYAERVIAQAQKENVRNVYGTTAAILGATVVSSMLSGR